jgi:hypothetical protein
MILSDWVFSNDVQKHARWEETLSWARRHDLSELVSGLSEALMYATSEMSSYRVGPVGGPMHLAWNWHPREAVTSAVRSKILEFLRANWPAIAGTVLAGSTKPTAITGKKGRRLLVSVDEAASAPPWGTWTSLAKDERRRSFTEFRRAINEAIAPIEIDHIDFAVASTTQPKDLS